MSGSGRLQIHPAPSEPRGPRGPRAFRDSVEERWALQLGGPIQSNLVVADLDGDGLLDLVVADRRALHVFLSHQAGERPMTSPLPALELGGRLDRILANAERLVASLPSRALDHKPPERDRTVRDLAFHVFRVGLA